MSKHSKKLKKPKITWGTPESYFPFKMHVAPLDQKNLLYAKHLTLEQRIEWLMMMQELLIQQFSKKK